ncbi:MAG: cupin domain-containing protein [Pseudomonadota bacterium]
MGERDPLNTVPTVDSLSAQEVIRLLGLNPHPEGGHFLETFRDTAPAGTTRGASTAIYYLLAAGEYSHWHRIDAAEIWHHYAGGPMALTISDNGIDAQGFRLGKNISAGERPQAVVPANSWQTAESLGRWSLVGCTVAPAFDFKHFEMAEPNWAPSPKSGPIARGKS